MLNQKKIRIMTRLAKIEQREEKKALSLANYFRSDYVRFELIKTILAVTVGYGIIVIMGILYYSEYLMENFSSIHYKEIIWKIGMGYFGILLIYTLIAGIGYFIRYNLEAKKVKYYLQLLNLYRKVCKEEIREWKSY